MKLNVEVCLNSNQPKESEMAEYNVYFYDEDNEEIDDMWEGNKLGFQVTDLMKEVNLNHEVQSIVWRDINGDIMKG